MKYTILLILAVTQIMASMIKAPIVDIEGNFATIKVDHIDVGVSGFVVHQITPQNSAIVNSVTVVAYNTMTKTATLSLKPYKAISNKALSHAVWKPKKGDMVYLAFAYSRALLIAPSENIYHKISKSVPVEWVHPDLFATMLSFAGHPTPLQSDFFDFANSASVGLLFIYLDTKVYTVDIKSFKILDITDTPFIAKNKAKPFYTRVAHIDAAWWGAGSDEMQEYAPHYYELLVKNNPKNQELYEIVKNHKNLADLADEFEIGK
jgi:hypothetical protein